MFKRVGSIVLTVVMMLTMACSTFALEGDPMALEVRVDGNVAEAAPGDTVKVYVDLTGDVGALASITVLGTYDTDVFALQEADITAATVNNNFDIQKTLVAEAESDQIRVVWWNAIENVTPATGNLLELEFTVKEGAATGNTAFSFAFKPDGMTYIGGDGNPAYLTAGVDYAEAAAASGTINILPATKASLLAGVMGGDTVEIGDTVEVYVQVNNYRDDWAGLVVEGSYDKDLLTLTAVSPEPLCDNDAIIVRDDTAGTLSVGWINEESIVVPEDDVVLFTLTFTAKAAGEASFNFSFKDGGVVSVDSNNIYTVKVAGTDYVEAAVPVSVKVIEEAVLPSIELRNVSVENIEVGGALNVAVALVDYAGGWASVTVEGTFDPSLVELTAISGGGFTANDPIVVIDNTNGTFAISWIGASNVTGGTYLLGNLAFTAKAEGTATINASIKDEGVVSIGANGEYLLMEAGTDYIKAAEALSVTVGEAQPNAAPNLTAEVVDNVTTVEKGETVTVKVNVNEYADDWAGFAIEGTFNKDLFELTTVTPAEFGTNDAVVVKDNDNGKLSVAWMNGTNVDGAINFTALTLVFTAKAAGTGAFNFNFKDEGVVSIGANGEYITMEAGTDYVKAADEVSVAVTDSTPAAVLKPTVSVKDNKTEVKRGETVTLIVGVENYDESLTGFTFGGAFDANIFDATSIGFATETLGDLIPTPVVDAENNVYHVAFMGTTAYDADASTFKAFEVTLTAKADATLGDTSLGIFFKADGMADANGEALDASKFDAEQKTVTVEILEADDTECTHDWSGTPVHKDGTSGTASKHVYTCANGCGETKEEACTVSTNKTPATCIAAGEITYSCSVCDYEETVTDPDAPAKGHDFTGTPTHKDGTSGTDSKHVYTCANGCSETKEEACTVVTTLIGPTPTEYGKINYHCDVCGYDETVNDPDRPPIPSGHTWSAVPTHKEGTTGAASKHVYTCTDEGCDVSYEENCDFSAEVFAPTCGGRGYTTYTCKDCGYVYTGNYVDALPAHTNVVTRYYAADRYTGGANGWIDQFCFGCYHRVEDAIIVKAGQVFPDVSATAVDSAWYYDAVAFCKAFGIFGGDEKGNFNPGQNITRGQMVTVLGRMMMPEAEKQMSAAQFNAFLASQGSLTSTPSTNSLSDVGGMYYERYAKLLAKWGIVTGYTDGTFKGDNYITRQEMATLLKRFVEAYAGTSSVSFGNAATFADMASVDAWAKANVDWTGDVGLFQGDQNKNYNPHSNATRAEIAVVISRMLPVLDDITIVRMTGKV